MIDDHVSLLARILAGDRDVVTRRAADASFDADRFLEFLWDHSLGGHVCDLLEAHGVLDAFPRPFPGRLRRTRQDQEEDGRRIIERVATLADAFDEAGVDVVFVKGPALATRFYDGPTARRTLDVDLWTWGEGRLEAAARVLGATGHRRRSHLPTESRAARHFAHNVEFAGDDGVDVDLHWAFAAHFSYRIDYGAVWRRRERAVVAGREVGVLATRDVLLLLTLGIFADLQRGRLRLRHMVDYLRVAEVLDERVGWDAWLAARDADGTGTIAGIVARLVLATLECSSRLPALTATVARRQVADAPPRAKILRLLSRTERGVANKLWAFRYFRGGPVVAALWWLASLPVKWAVYR